MRDKTKLHPKLQKLMQKHIDECKKQGLIIGIGECVRTKAEQDELYAQGRTKPGKIVTNAKGSNYGSMHMWALAYDVYRNDGKGAFNDSDGFFTKVGKIGQSIGLEWGGSWKSPVDKPHFQLPNWGSTPARLKSLYGTPERFFKTWGNTSNKISSSEEYDMKTIQKGCTGRAVRVWQIIVGVTADGEFGANTVTATKKFQKEHGLTADGIVGRLTWNKGLTTL